MHGAASQRNLVARSAGGAVLPLLFGLKLRPKDYEVLAAALPTVGARAAERAAAQAENKEWLRYVKYRVTSWVVRGVVFGSHAHGAAGKTHAMLLTAVKLRQLCSRRVFMSAVLAAACPRRCLRPRE